MTEGLFSEDYPTTLANEKHYKESMRKKKSRNDTALLKEIQALYAEFCANPTPCVRTTLQRMYAQLNIFTQKSLGFTPKDLKEKTVPLITKQKVQKKKQENKETQRPHSARRRA